MTLATTARHLMRQILPESVRAAVHRIQYLGLPEPIRTVRPHTMLSNLNLFFLQELSRRLDEAGVAGDFVECGVYRGGSAALLGYEMQRSRFTRHLWLYDAFQGMPTASEQDDAYSHSIAGQFIGSEVNTRRLLKHIGLCDEAYRIIVGWLEETLSRQAPTCIALLHVDCDFYSPITATLETLFDRVESGGFIVLNDYGSFDGCRRATDEFLARRGIDLRLTQIDRDAWYFQKPLPSYGDDKSTAERPQTQQDEVRHVTSV